MWKTLVAHDKLSPPWERGTWTWACVDTIFPKDAINNNTICMKTNSKKYDPERDQETE